MADQALVNIKVNGVAIQAPAGENVIEAARRANIDIPFFCYHPRLSMEEGGANCRMCLVEVAMPRRNPDGSTVMAKMPKPQTACSLPIAEGMEIETETEQVVGDRRGILEFLLINHPLDCPICDRGGECPLQNNTLHYGPPTTRFIEEKRHFPKAYPLSDYVVFDRERCIHCARCTRFTRDISGDSQLGFLFRGADMEVGTFAQTDMKSRFSGNVIELCPVGALLSRSYRFKARPWDLLTQKSICTQCANGCNIKMDSRVGSLQRVNARENDYVNEEWTCDKGKFGMGYVSSDDRLKQPLIRENGKFRPATWDEANRLITSKLRDAGKQIGGIGGARTFNEDLFVFQKFFREVLGVNNLDCRMGPNFGSTSSVLKNRLGYHTMGNSIEELEGMKSFLVFGSNLVDEQPILFLRLRKAWRKYKASVVEAVSSASHYGSQPNHVSEFAGIKARYNDGTELGFINGLNAAAAGDEAGLNQASQLTGVTADCFRSVFDSIVAGSTSIILGESIKFSNDFDAICSAVCDLAESTGNGGNVNLPVTTMNGQGAMDLGVLPDSGPGYAPVENVGLDSKSMLEATASGNIKFLWIVGSDPVAEFYDPELVKKGLENCAFTVVHAHSLNATAQMADVVLPVQTIAERDGSLTNVERRVQRFWKSFEVGPEIQPDWLVFQHVSALLGCMMPYFSVRDISREIASSVPAYAGCSLRDLGDTGVRWTYSA